ncbi:MAG: tetratricopeptide repeat protein [Chitinispirillales bacterium]|jgi:tetratricopeptide (TPR) repeat protein|nr:tetratricopeptide repeat protein [Chitinispirillales bacterium]
MTKDSLISTPLISTSLNERGVPAAMAVRAVLTIIIVSLFSNAFADEVGAKNRKANRLYSKGQYEEALKLYDDALLLEPSNGRLKMNKGSTLYRLGELDEAEKSYLDAVSSQLNKKTMADAHYNLGNIQYRQAEKLESAGDAASARKKYSGALESYVNTLKLRPSDMDAKWNLQMAHQKMNLMKEQQDREQDENKDKDKQQGDQNQQKDNQQGDKDDKDNKDDKDGQENKERSDDKERRDDNEHQGKDDRQQQPDKGEQKKEEASRLIEQYADDSDTLNKPRFQRARIRQPEKDW